MKLEDAVAEDSVAVRTADIHARTFTLDELFNVRFVLYGEGDGICPVFAR